MVVMEESFPKQLQADLPAKLLYPLKVPLMGFTCLDYSIMHLKFRNPSFFLISPKMPFSKIIPRAALFMNMVLLGAFSQTAWTLRNSGTTNDLAAITWAHGQFVAVGGGSTILTSPDGMTWTKRLTSNGSLRTVVWTGSNFVAGGQDSVRLSSDGIVWVPKSGAPQLTSMIWAGTKLMGVYPIGIVSSTDGYNWVTTGGGSFLTSIAWSGSRYVAVGASGLAMSSANGTSWITLNVGSSTIRSIAWTGTQFVAVSDGGYLLSPDGVNWQSAQTNPMLNSIVWVGNQLVGVGDFGTIRTSPDGVNWTAKTSGISSVLTSVASSGSLLVAVGQNGTILTSPQDPVSITPDFSARDNLSFRLESNQLFATLPSSFLGTYISASIFTVNGNKVREVNAGNSATGIPIALGNLTNGIYLFELQSEDIRMTRTFSIMR